MPGPIVTFVLFAALGVLLAVVLWPGRGLLARVNRIREDTERIRLEDGLKHLLDCERAGRPVTVETMAGRLEVSRGVASEILTKLTERGLAGSGPAGGASPAAGSGPAAGSSSGAGSSPAAGPSSAAGSSPTGRPSAGRSGPAGASDWHLTEPGRAYALRILRTHRLWERYLADRTGVPATEWHGEAERVEHQLSEAEAEELASRLGDPRYDPHGDPIPTAGGEIPARAGTSLGRVEPGESVVVRHLEDEPEEVFERLVALGLAPGAVLEVIAGEAGGSGAVRIRVRGEEHELRAVDAANVTVEPVPEAGADDGAGPHRTLADAERGEAVRVTGLSPACQGPQRRRLLDLGVVPGTEITPELVSSGGDPVAYRIRGALIALRREQAEWIGIEARPARRAS